MAPLPSWEEIETEASERGYPPSRRAAWLLRASQRPGSGAAGPLLLLWRDDFGWCPFSQQAQFHLEEKGVAYHVRKLPLTLYRLGNRDAEHLSDSPEGLVPALRVLEERCCGMATPKRGAVAIGAADVRAFIEDYCSGPQLLRGASISHCLQGTRGRGRPTCNLLVTSRDGCGASCTQWQQPARSQAQPSGLELCDLRSTFCSPRWRT
mmetsp:Transcript_8070/g.18994  ORF Transcript_8070/g.18994 Transcript_8070/m.18994 type:complete len:208 (+) Transcript_8070:52-675(+)